MSAPIEGIDEIVVGVEGSPTFERALVWAAEAAVERNVPLRIVHTWTMPVTPELPDPLVLEPLRTRGQPDRCWTPPSNGLSDWCRSRRLNRSSLRIGLPAPCSRPVPLPRCWF